MNPSSNDQVFVGQSATVLSPAFNQRTTPELQGQVQDVSATTSVDEISGQSFSRVEVGVPGAALTRLDGPDRIPDMPVEGFLTATEGTVLRYRVKLLGDQLTQAFPKA